MTTNFPDLSAWNRVPDGSTIPKDTPYAYTYAGALTVELDGHFEDYTVSDNSYCTYYTEHPVPPPLPTEPGTQILASIRSDRTPSVLMERTDRGWYCSEYVYYYGDDEITAWVPITLGEPVVIR